MQMKKMMLLAAATLAGVLVADVSVEDVKCTQRYPWNGLVDIEYTIACDDPNAEIYVNPIGFNGDTGLTVFPTHFSGDGATNTVKAGKHKMVWDAKSDMGLFASKHFQIKIYAGKTLAPYVVVDLSSGPDGENFPIRYSLTGPDMSDDTCRTTELWLRLIPPGTFMMGSPADELGRSDNEYLHKVTITQPFYIGVFEVTYEQYYRVRNVREYHWNDNLGGYPTLDVSYEDLRGDVNNYRPNGNVVDGNCFFGILRRKTGCNGFDLPSEAQWEYACRFGTETSLNIGKNLTGIQGCHNMNAVGRYMVNGYNGAAISWSSQNINTIAKVGSFLPNGAGLYDMHGNVSEICLDTFEWASGNFYNLGTDAAIDPLSVARTGLHSTQCRPILRGGQWNSSAARCRSAARSEQQVGECHETTGFRISCPGNLQK